jgi:hypothetical protein
MKDKHVDQWICTVFLLLAIIVTSITRSGGEPGTQSYVERQRQAKNQVAGNQFCLSFASEISGTVEYKKSIYQDCKGD